jgi:hypothetical protein
VLWFFFKRDVGINVLVALIVSSFVIGYLNNKSITMNDTAAENLKIKKQMIVPSLTDDSQKHKMIIDLLFSVQDLYAYSPQHYEDMIKSINNFYSTYSVCFIDLKTCHINYGLMKQSKRDALNAFKSIIFSLPDDPKMRDKVNNTAIVLDGIMTEHLDQISYLIDEVDYKYGYNVDTKIIDYGPVAFNEYDDMFKNYTYDVY